jgi:thermitase
MKKSTILLLFLALAAGLLAYGGGKASAGTRARYVTGQILVRFEQGVSASDRATLMANQNAALERKITGDGVYIVKVPAGAERQTVERLNKTSGIVLAGVDSVSEALARPGVVTIVPNYFDRQYALLNNGESFTNTAGNFTVAPGIPDADIDADEAWAITKGGGVTVAVLDTGVDLNHEDIKVTKSVNFSGTRSADDQYGHGTHVAGIIAAQDNSKGVSGVCPSCQIISAKVLNDSGNGSESMTLQGIEWALQNGASVINMSLGFAPGPNGEEPQFLEAAVNKAVASGVTVTAAAGNINETNDATYDDAGPMYPAMYENVIAVGATDNNDTKTAFSNYASWVDVAAPGANVYSTFPNHKFALQRLAGRALSYDIANGTSMSSPVVAGVAGLVKAVRPNATVAQVRVAIEQTTDKNDNYSDAEWRYGRVNALAAVNYALANY